MLRGGGKNRSLLIIVLFTLSLSACGGGAGGSSAPTLSGIALSGDLSTSSTVTGKKYLNGDNGVNSTGIPLTTKSLGASWTPGTGNVTVDFIEDATGTTKHTGTVDASVGTYKVTYTLAGSTDAADVYNWPDGKYRIVVTPAGGTATTLEVWKDTVAPTNTVSTVTWDSYSLATTLTTVVTVTPTAGQVVTVNNSHVQIAGSCGTDTVMTAGFGFGASLDYTTFIWNVTYQIGDINVVYVPGFYCIDDAGNYGGLGGFAGVEKL